MASRPTLSLQLVSGEVAGVKVLSFTLTLPPGSLSARGLWVKPKLLGQCVGPVAGLLVASPLLAATVGSWGCLLLAAPLRPTPAQPPA